MAWLVILRGEDLDLEMLKEELTGLPHSVNQDEDGDYLLGSDWFDGLTDAVEVKETARRVVQQINAACRLDSRGYRPVEVTGQLRNGIHLHTVIDAKRAVSRSRAGQASVVGGGESRPAPQRSRSSRLIEAAAEDRTVEEALTILQDDDVDWVRLYKVLEIVRADLGDGDSGIDGLPGVSIERREAFKQSANHPDVSGASARHARQSGRPPKKEKTMTINEGREFIVDVLSSWIASKEP